MKVTEGMHGEKGENCVAERGKIATEETLLGKVEEPEANERGRVPELQAVRGIGDRKQSGTNNPGGRTNGGAQLAGRGDAPRNSQYNG